MVEAIDPLADESPVLAGPRHGILGDHEGAGEFDWQSSARVAHGALERDAIARVISPARGISRAPLRATIRTVPRAFGSRKEDAMATKAAVLLGVVLLCGAPMEAAAKEMRFRVKYSGTAMSISWASPGTEAGLGTVAGKSTLGPWSSQGIGKSTVLGPGTCPNGNAGIDLTLIPGTGHSIARLEKTGELIFSELTSETVCYDPSTRTQFKTGTDKITGGTGRFVGATGETRFEGTQWPLYVDAQANGFAAQIGTVTGTIILP